MTDLVSEMTFPTAILLGPGMCSRLPERCRRLGMKRPLMVTDPGLVEQGLAGRVEKCLAAEGLLVGLFAGVVANPSEREIEAAAEAHLAHGCDGVVAVGGGSVIETAKLMRVLATHERPLGRYSIESGGSEMVTGRVAPMIAVPTAPGIGPEVTPRAAARLGEHGRIATFAAPALLPQLALCDPALAVTLPPGPTSWSGMAAFSSCLEAFCASGLHPLADALAIDGLARCARSLLKAIESPGDLGARTDLAIASIEAGAASEKGLGVCSALAVAISSVTGIRQGLAAAICLDAALEFNRPAIGSRLAKIALALGERTDARQALLASAAVDRVLRLSREANIPSGLKEAGVREDQLPLIAEAASGNAALQANPRSVGGEDLLQILRDCY